MNQQNVFSMRYKYEAYREQVSLRKTHLRRDLQREYRLVVLYPHSRRSVYCPRKDFVT